MAYYLFHVNAWKYFEFSDGSTIGRVRGDLVYVNDNMLSGTHAKLYIKDENSVQSVFIEDLDSKNGTKINGHAIKPKELIRVENQNLLEIGNQKFILTDRMDLKVNEVNTLVEQMIENRPLALQPNEVMEKYRNENVANLKKMEQDEKNLRGDIIQIKRDIEEYQSKLKSLNKVKDEENKKAEKEKQEVDKDLEKKRIEAHQKIDQNKFNALIKADAETEELKKKIKECEFHINDLDVKATDLKRDAESKRKKLEKYIKIPN